MTFPKDFTHENTHTCADRTLTTPFTSVFGHPPTVRPGSEPLCACILRPLASGPRPLKATILPRCLCDECDESCRLVAVPQEQESGLMLNQKKSDDNDGSLGHRGKGNDKSCITPLSRSHLISSYISSCVVSSLISYSFLIFSHFLTSLS